MRALQRSQPPAGASGSARDVGMHRDAPLRRPAPEKVLPAAACL